MTTQIIGKDTTPVDGGSNAASGHLVFAEAVLSDSTIETVQIWNRVAATVVVEIFNRSGDDFTRVIAFAPVAMSPGLNTITLNAPVLRGQYIGFNSTTSGWAAYTASTPGPAYYYGATLTAETFTDTTSTSSLITEVSVLLNRGTTLLESFYTQNHTIQQIIGKDTTPITGGNSSSGTIVFAENAMGDGIIRTVEVWNNVAATVTPGIFTKLGDDFTRITILTAAELTPGLNTLGIDVPIRKGQYIGFTCPTTGWVSNVSATGDAYYYGETLTAEAFTDTTPSTGVILQISIHVDVFTEKHLLSLHDCDRIVVLGDSWSAGYYQQRGKTWIHKVSLFSDFNWDSVAIGGETAATQLGRLRATTDVWANNMIYRNMGVTYGFIMIGYNDYTGTNSVTYANFVANFRQLTEAVVGAGAIPIIATGALMPWDNSVQIQYKALAEEVGAYFCDWRAHAQIVFNGTQYNNFFQGSYTGTGHTGVRTNHVMADPIERYLARLKRPKNSIKIFRKRGTITVTDIDEDLMFRDIYERAQIFREIYTNHIALTEATENHYDHLANPADYDNSDIIVSDYFKMMGRGLVNFDDYALIDVIIDGVEQNIMGVDLWVSEPGVSVWVRDSLISPFPANTLPISQWAVVAGDGAGTFSLREPLHGKVQFDRISFLLYKSGGFSITEPLVTWYGRSGKPDFPVVEPQARATGPELLLTRLTHTLTGWTVVGSLTPDTSTTYMLPYGTTGFVTVDATNKLKQTLNYSTPGLYDMDIEIKVICRRFPDVFLYSSSYPSTAPITQETFDWTRLIVELVDAGGTYVYAHKKKVGLWWDEVVFRSILPVREVPLAIQVSAESAVQVARVSVRALSFMDPEPNTHYNIV